MIINTGGRTDTVQYYSDWLFNRFREGYVLSRNPLFPGKVTRYELSPDKVDAVLFCSKNYAPALSRIREISDRYRTYFYYTITAYGKDIEPGVPSIGESVETLKELSRIVGKKKLAWRYDPVLFTDKYTLQAHAETFGRIAEEISPYVDRCIFSFVEMYKKLAVNMPELRPVSEEQKCETAAVLGGIAARYNMRIQTCGTNGDFSQFGICPSGCVTLGILAAANGCEFRELKHRGMREGCHCIESRDIGVYNSCPNGCKYCYANKDHRAAIENYKQHDKYSPRLLGRLQNMDIVMQGEQKSFLKADIQQISLFD